MGKSRYDEDANDDYSLDSSSISEDRKKKKRKKSSHKKHKKDKHKKKDRKRSRHRDHDESESDGDSSSDSRGRSRKKDKKKHKSEKQGHKHSKKSSRNDNDDDRSSSPAAPELGRSDVLAQALCKLLDERPLFANELPLILIRIAGGAAFDLRQMTDYAAAQGLHTVFDSLASFGVQQNPETKLWIFNSPAPGNRDELVLLRVIRALLGDIGISMEDVQSYETNAKQQEELRVEKAKQKAEEQAAQALAAAQKEDLEDLKARTRAVLVDFSQKDAQLGQQLAGLCKTIAEGESISIDALPDTELKTALEAIFVQCGLEKSEMQDDDDSDNGDGSDADEDGPLMGYGLPDDENSAVQIKLASVMEACRNPIAPATRRAIGPARGPMTKEEMQASSAAYPNKSESEEDDEGPVAVGAAKRRTRGPAIPQELIEAEAGHRELELKATVQGVSMPTKEGEREEWMLVPGKHDFLSTIKSGQTIKSRGFENKKARGDGNDDPRPIHPAIQAEMDAIMEAHANARGPSLIEQHRAKLRQDKEEAATKKGESWIWNRDNDLDAGRRVDKNALNMVLGGAVENLKSKFQGGFRG
jgi:hypothetical protein